VLVPALTPRQIIEAAVAAHGGVLWLGPGTLYLAGPATFYAPDSTTPRSHADDYRMWRVMNLDRTTAHGADGKVRITARSGELLLFNAGARGLVDLLLRRLAGEATESLVLPPLKIRATA
jgi:hypothetical protein